VHFEGVVYGLKCFVLFLGHVMLMGKNVGNVFGLDAGDDDLLL